MYIYMYARVCTRARMRACTGVYARSLARSHARTIATAHARTIARYTRYHFVFSMPITFFIFQGELRGPVSG